MLDVVQCDGNPLPPPDCKKAFNDRAAAVAAVAARAACMDDAIAALERFTLADGRVRSDLAAAYYVRAYHDDRPSDLLHALRNGRQAVKDDPRNADAQFNLALAQEALGLSAEAIQSWKAFLELGDSPWSQEARERHDRLLADRAASGTARWAEKQKALPSMLDRTERQELAQLAALFPSATQRYLEEELLPQWAESPSPVHLERAKRMAAALAERTGDLYALHIVEAVERTPDAQRDALRRGLRALRTARHYSNTFQWGDSRPLYEQAADAFRRTGNPLHLVAELDLAVALSSLFKPDMHLLVPVEQQAQQHRYAQLLARTLATRAYFLHNDSLHLESLRQYDAALAIYERHGDGEGMANVHARKAGVLRTAGMPQLSLGEALRAMRHISSIVTPRQRHVALGEIAKAAAIFDQNETALLYQNAAVDLILKEASADMGRSQNLGIALRERAAIHLRLRNYEQARPDLECAATLEPSTDDPANRAALNARIEEVQGQLLSRVPSEQALARFSNAIQLAVKTEHRTFVAGLYIQRAEVLRRLNRREEAKQDLVEALKVLRAEETALLEAREPGQAEELWSAYFARFDETHDRLIHHYVEDGDFEEAFRSDERSRSFELLALLKTFGAKREPLALQDIRRELPPGTFLLQYSVQEERTYVWILSRDRFVFQALPVPRRTVERWSADLRPRPSGYVSPGFKASLRAAFDRLLRDPLTAIRGMPGGRKPRLVFVPDGAMHGFPFAALYDTRTRQYLVETAPISVAGSATLYVVSLQRDRALASNDPPSILLFGNPRFDTSLDVARGLADLRYAQKEALDIAALYAPHATVHTGADATPERLFDNAHRFTIVHLAAHAIANADFPTRSLILLAPSSSHSGEVQARSLLTELKLDRCRLFVLSACSSAGGVPVGPEGVAPLVRPILAAGVPAVIGSLWNVPDATAASLMVSFHRDYRQGKDAAVALQSAQLEMLRGRDPRLQSELRWASFQVIGYASSPDAPER